MTQRNERGFALALNLNVKGTTLKAHYYVGSSRVEEGFRCQIFTEVVSNVTVEFLVEPLQSALGK